MERTHRRTLPWAPLAGPVLIALVLVATNGCMWAMWAPASFAPTGINDTGVVVGATTSDLYSHAVEIMANGVMVTLPVPAGEGSSVAVDVNDAGAAVGWFGGRVLVWLPDGSTTAIAGFPVSAVAFPSAINTSGQVAGWFAVVGDNRFRPFVSSPPYAGVEELPVPSGFLGAQAWAVNDRGVVVGFGFPAAGPSRALRWQLGNPTTVEVLGPNLDPSERTMAFDVNDDGAVVGWSGTAVVEWLPGSTTAAPLSAGPGVAGSDAGPRINDAGCVVATFTLANGTVRPYRLDATGGPWTELAPGASEPIIQATGINDRNTAVGTAGTSTSTRPVTFT